MRKQLSKKKSRSERPSGNVDHYNLFVLDPNKPMRTEMNICINVISSVYQLIDDDEISLRYFFNGEHLDLYNPLESDIDCPSSTGWLSTFLPSKNLMRGFSGFGTMDTTIDKIEDHLHELDKRRMITQSGTMLMGNRRQRTGTSNRRRKIFKGNYA